jgi:hypothetical protein
MIQTNANKNSLKQIRKKEAEEKDAKIKTMCEAFAIEKFGETTIKELSNKWKGIWYLPILDDEEENIEKLAILKPIDRNILSYASQKMSDEGLYAFLEAAMRECILPDHSDMEILDDDDYFIPASQSFNKILDGKKAYLLKR